ncbi:MAG: molybdopterin-binding protein [Candidatus Eisenbacteria bacterium]
MTGAPVPRGADGVVMVEKSTPLEGSASDWWGRSRRRQRAPGWRAPGLSPRGQRRGARPRGAPARSSKSKATSRCWRRSGASTCRCSRRCQRRLLPPVPRSCRPRPNRPTQIRNSNGPSCALFEESRVVKLVRDSSAPDDSRRLARAIDQSRHARVLVLTGGVSMGDFDLVPKVLTEAGYVVRFHRIAIRPGKPLLFATRGRGKDQQVAFGLPGNPVSVLVTAWEFLLPYLRAAAGCGEPGPWVVRARALERIARRPGLAQFVLASIAEVDGTLGVREVPWNGSGDFVAAARANALLPLDPTRGVVEEGEICPVHPLVQIGWPVAGGEK